MALDQPGVDLNEQRIGVEVFGREANYDTAEDTIVRVHASELRKRLKAYFEDEGADSPILVDIPKGSYLPVFSTREAPSETAASGIRRSVAAGLALAVGLAGWWGRGLWEARGAGGELLTSPALSLLWRHFDKSDQRTFVVVADSTHGLLQDLRRQTIPLTHYASREYWNNQDPDEVGRVLKNREYTGMADLALVRKLALGFGSHSTRLQMIFARHFHMRQMNTDNAVLVGSKRSNPWAEVFDPMLNFVFDYDETVGRALVRNRNPREGEQPVYAASIASDGVKQGYALVAFLPNLRRSGSVLLLAGTSGAETEIAGFFVTDEATFARFTSQLPREPGGRLPYFEALLKTQRVGQETQRHDLVAYRLIAR